MNLPAPPDARCDDPAFALQNPDVCPVEPQLLIKPSFALVCELGSVQFKAFIVRNGQETDVTEDTIFNTSDTSIAVVGAISGNATGLALGSADISAAYDGKTAHANLTVLGSNCCSDRQVAMQVVLDTSRSMSLAFSSGYSSRLAFGKFAAKRFIDEVNQNKDLIGLQTFNQVDNTVLSSPTANKAAVSALVNGIAQSTQKTAFYDALVTAIAELDAAGADLRVIVLISDGEDQTTSYTSANNPLELLNDFKTLGGIVITLGVRASGKGYNLLSALATGGFFLNAYGTTADASLDYLSGLKGYICAGNCTPEGDIVVGQGALNYTGFQYWDVVGGTVDLQGNGFFDFLPGNGLYVDMAGTTPNRTGKLVSKTPFSIVAGNDYRVTVRLSGNQRVDATPESVRLRVYYLNNDPDATEIYLLDQKITINDFTQDFQAYAFTFQPSGNYDVYISIQQEEQPASADTRIGLFLGSVVFDDVTNLTNLLTDNFDNENPTYINPRCGVGTLYAYIQYLGGYGYGSGDSCTGEGCLDEPPTVQLQDPSPLPDIEAGYTPPTVYNATRTACASCASGQVNAPDTSAIPVMTSNTAPSGVASASTVGVTAAWNAFDGIKAFVTGNPAIWTWQSTAIPAWIQYQFPAAKIITGYKIWSYSTGHAPKDFIFQGSNDGTTWTDLDTHTSIPWYTNEAKLFLFTNTTAYLYYRLYISALSDASFVDAILAELEMFEAATVEECATASATSEISQSDANTQAYNAALATATAALNCLVQYTSTQQYTAKCDYDLFPVTRSATRTSIVSQQEADAAALAAATALAEAAKNCNQSNNDQKLTIIDAQPGQFASASPYPMVKSVSGLSGAISKMTLTLRGFAHEWPEDVQMLLVAPGGVASCVVMRHCGGSSAVTGLTIVIDDDAGSPLPDSTILTSGTFQPAQYGTSNPFNPPAPQSGYGTTLAVFDGISPNGMWALFVLDDASVHVGQLATGFDLTFTLI